MASSKLLLPAPVSPRDGKSPAERSGSAVEIYEVFPFERGDVANANGIYRHVAYEM